MEKTDAPSKSRSVTPASLLPAHATAPRAPTGPQSLPMGITPKPGPPPSWSASAPAAQPPPAVPDVSAAPQEGSDGQPQLTARERAIRVSSAGWVTDCESG